MELGTGELFDKLSIVQLKSERIDMKSMRKELRELMDAFKETETSYGTLPVECSDLLELLKILNGLIWDLEADIRQGKEGELGLEEVGRRALAIRNINHIRVWTKNLVTRTTGIGYSEVKKDHAAAGT